MPEFILRTETERQLYIEALLHCLDHGTLTEREVLEDFCDLLSALGLQTSDFYGAFIRESQSRLADYRAGRQNQKTTAERLLSLFNRSVAAAASKGCHPDA